MKTIANLNHLLAFQLEGLYEIIRGLQEELPFGIRNASDPELKALLEEYKQGLADQRTKLKRIFSYLLNGPYGRKPAKGAGALASFKEIADREIAPELKDILIITSLQSASRFLVQAYNDTSFMAMRVEMDSVVKMLDDMVDMNEDFIHRLKFRSATQINEACSVVGY